jgi:cytochrome c
VGNVPRGKRAFSVQCASCHAITAETRPTGPGLAGVIGRAAGKAEGFAYSEGMKKAGLTWTPEVLDRYLATPGEVVPGTTMVLAVPQASTRADLIAYLQTLGNATAGGSR